MKEIYRTLAEQLKKPHGDLAIQVAEKLNEVNETINLLSIEALDPAPGDHILEVGMANGFFVKEIFKRQPDIHYTGCDYSVKMVYEANRINKEFIDAGKAACVMAEASSLPFEDSTFTKVMSVATLYYFDDPERVLNEFHRVLKENGLLIISIRPKAIMELYGTAEFTGKMFTREELSDCLVANGFHIMAISEHREPEIKVLDERYPSSCLIAVARRN